MVNFHLSEYFSPYDSATLFGNTLSKQKNTMCFTISGKCIITDPVFKKINVSLDNMLIIEPFLSQDDYIVISHIKQYNSHKDLD